jgi:hypothetical protein
LANSYRAPSGRDSGKLAAVESPALSAPSRRVTDPSSPVAIAVSLPCQFAARAMISRHRSGKTGAPWRVGRADDDGVEWGRWVRFQEKGTGLWTIAPKFQL